MTTLEETAYQRLPAEPMPRDLVDHYTPSKDELTWARRRQESPIKRAGLLIQLKILQRLGYFLAPGDIPRPNLDHIAKASGLARTLSKADLKSLEGRRTHEANLASVRQRMEIQPLKEKGWLSKHAAEAALTHHQLVDIINILLELLVRHRFEIPGFTTLLRTARTARNQIDSRHFASITDKLTARMRAKIDELLTTPASSSRSGWDTLKDEPSRPTNAAVREYLAHVREVQQLADSLPAVDIPVAKLKHYRAMARAFDASEMTEIKPNKRYALAVIFIRSCQARALDDAAELFIRLYDRLEIGARKRLREFLLERADLADALIERFHGTLVAYGSASNAAQRIKGIDIYLAGDVDRLRAMCEEHMGFAGQNYIPFMVDAYAQSRSLLFNCLRIIQPRSTTAHRGVENSIEALHKLRQSRLDVITLSDFGLDAKSDLGWMVPFWRRMVFGTANDQLKAGTAHRTFLELAILHQVRQDLNHNDLHVLRSEKFNDYREQLVDMATFEAEKARYGEITGIEVDAKALVQSLKALLTCRAREVDAAFATNESARINNGRLSLSKFKPNEPSTEFKVLDDRLREVMLPISILDVIVDVERWLDLHRHFRPLAGTESRITDRRQRTVMTIFSYGCNLGPTQASRSVKGYSRRQISWLNHKHVTEEALEKATVAVINAFNKFELPGYWGTGKSLSADGTKLELYEQNLMSEYHIRYGGYGGIGYFHVSDKYIAMFSRFISCGVYEGTYLLDEMMRNESDIRPDTVHGDTHSQNYAVFALAHMLGIRLMPRIKGVHKLKFFRPTPGERYQNIDDLFAEAINWRVIGNCFEDMLRIVVSIKLGKISASTILQMLSSTNNGRLALAFRELGKVLRTLFLLDYIETAELRKIINAATNKSEQFNRFLKWLFFGSEGVIQENVAHEQRKMIKYGHLLTAIVSLHNVQSMTTALRSLQAEGKIAITAELLGMFSPYRTSHINRFGDYVLDYDRPWDPLNPGLTILPNRIILPENSILPGSDIIS